MSLTAPSQTQWLARFTVRAAFSLASFTSASPKVSSFQKPSMYTVAMVRLETTDLGIMCTFPILRLLGRWFCTSIYQKWQDFVTWSDLFGPSSSRLVLFSDLPQVFQVASKWNTTQTTLTKPYKKGKVPLLTLCQKGTFMIFQCVILPFC